MLRVIVSAGMIALSLPTFAAGFTDDTPCSEMMKAARRHSQTDLLRFTDYIVDTFWSMDREEIAAGRLGIMDLVSRAEIGTMVADTAAVCRKDPEATIRAAATVVFLTALHGGS
jgi:hypothetical protein